MLTDVDGFELIDEDKPIGLLDKNCLIKVVQKEKLMIEEPSNTVDTI